MPQADQLIANASFPTVRADINSNLLALFSNNSGNIEPSPAAGAAVKAVEFMDWLDTSGANPIWKKRNAGNNAWITVATIVGNTISFEGTLPSQSGQSGKYLTTNGTVASWATVTAGGRLLRAPQMLTSGTSYTAPANCIAIYVEAVGGGGGGAGTSGGGGGGGGGAGGYCAKYFTVVPAATYTYTIGAGGVAEGTGGSTTFTVGATTITSAGGGGGSIESTGGAGGACTNGDINISGGGGGAGGTSPQSGAGGNSFFGGGGAGLGGQFGSSAGSAGSAGGGGSGGFSNGGNVAGGAGGAGLIRIWEYS